MGPPRKIGKQTATFAFVFPMENMSEMAGKHVRICLFPTHPNIADILGRTDFDFENLYFFPN